MSFKVERINETVVNDDLNDSSMGQNDLIGEGQLSLKPLEHLRDVPSDLYLIDKESVIKGHLEVNVIPCDASGTRNPDFIPSPSSDKLIGKRLDYLVKIKQAKLLPANLYNNVFCEYRFFDSKQKYTATMKEGAFKFDYCRQHSVEKVNAAFISYLQNDCIFFRVFGESIQAADEPSPAMEPPNLQVHVNSFALNRQSAKSGHTRLDRSCITQSSSAVNSNFILVHSSSAPRPPTCVPLTD